MTTTLAGKRKTLSVRAWEGSRHDLEDALKPESIAIGTLIGDTIDVLAGYFRCARCHGTPVPVSFGDLAGRPLWEAVTEAERLVRFQKCKDHAPVRVSFAPTPAASPVAAESDPAETVAQLQQDIPGLVPASELPPAGSAVFQTAGGSRVVAAETPGPKRKSRRASKCAHVVAAGTRCKICEPTR